ncbi:replication initiator protein [Blackfly microvirus SF02]|uniref:Replication initiator protein n=1 Tax=Blackfly microvirus SF02 TaxID=2576452 RepID=A0A4P8PK52_9VIRU|nr:replication initiator protein [Blackfly microvirus SF02]
MADARWYSSMSCVKPLRAYWRNAARDGITFNANMSATKIPFGLPCGRCIGCRLEKARQWGLRCLHEKKMHSTSCYLTLTYHNDYLPDGGTVVVRDMQLFFKRVHNRLLKRRGYGIRYFCGAEYGEDNGRPHYHALMFGYDFPDKVIHGRNARGEPLFVSKELSEVWFQGFSTIGEITFDSAVYCAKYALKKVNGDARAAHYTVYDEDGVCYERVPEFAIMSRNPGIGASYYAKYGKEVRDHDSVIVNGREVRPPRFYDTKSEFVDAESFALMKKKRKRMAVLNRLDNTVERLRVKEILMIRAAEKKERKL